MEIIDWDLPGQSRTSLSIIIIFRKIYFYILRNRAAVIWF